jgi:hypothetical protein
VSAVQNIALPSEPGDVHDVPAAARSWAHWAAGQYRCRRSIEPSR